MQGWERTSPRRKAHERDPVTIGQKRYAKEDVQSALEVKLKGVSMNPWRYKCVELGMYRGLKFSLDLSPHENPAVCVEGAVTRFEPLSREHRGPRAIMNAVARLVDSYGDERAQSRKRPGNLPGTITGLSESDRRQHSSMARI